MTTLQGDFIHHAAAEQARAALKQAGIADTRIRTWNILEGGQSGHRGGSTVVTGAAVGSLVAGGAGLIAGAGLGAILDENDGGPMLPDPSGFRVVVDVAGDGPQIEALLVAAGAANVKPGPASQ